MELTLERARSVTDRRDAAMEAEDVEGFLELWADDCTVEGPEHVLAGKDELRLSIEDAFEWARPVRMITRSLAVEGDAMFYEFAIVWEVRETLQRVLLTGMTYHRVDSQGLLAECREHFDPPARPRRSVADSPEVAPLLVADR